MRALLFGTQLTEDYPHGHHGSAWLKHRAKRSVARGQTGAQADCFGSRLEILPIGIPPHSAPLRGGTKPHTRPLRDRPGRGRSPPFIAYGRFEGPESRILRVDLSEPPRQATHNHAWTLVRPVVDLGERKRRRINESLDLSRGLG